MQAGPGGFAGAPVTKALVIATASTSLLLQAFSRGQHRRLPAYVALWTRLFHFSHVGQLLVGCILLYHSRCVRRTRPVALARCRQ